MSHTANPSWLQNRSLLAKAEPIRDGGSSSGIRKGNCCATAAERGLRRWESSSPAGTKVCETGAGRRCPSWDSPAAHGSSWRSRDPPAACGGAHARAGGCTQRRLQPLGLIFGLFLHFIPRYQWHPINIMEHAFWALRATQEIWGQQASTFLVVLSGFLWPGLWKWTRSLRENIGIWMHTSFGFNRRKQLSIFIELWKSINLQSCLNLQKQSWKGDARENQEEICGNEKVNLKQRAVFYFWFPPCMQRAKAKIIIISPHICPRAVCDLDCCVWLQVEKTIELQFHCKLYQEKRHSTKQRSEMAVRYVVIHAMTPAKSRVPLA